MAQSIFLKIEGPAVKGESKDSKHAGEMEVLSWSHSFNQPTSPTRSTAGAGTVELANHSDLTVTKYTDISSTDLMKLCWSGKQIDKVTIAQFRNSGDNPVEFLTIEMEHVVISNFSLSGGGGDIPVENISFAYGKVTYKYDPVDKATGDSTGNKPISHDLETKVVA